ncbi:gibberellin 2-beta-dioxygenase 8 [Phalaenopsis equestris]|uniref:gibberellin 2-beta-dioxygenase 8 n=1 Tax=Phalaenopsis equestris TaxID=78828 RepID=UPI0009E5F24B|nr:gibberellin 2-beta-dioxygenase 8 [Phalaenopsis equestris]
MSAAADPSYPPLPFDAVNAPTPPPPATETLNIPRIDFANLKPKQLGDACRSPGIFRLVNHGLPCELSGRIQAETRRILELPFERKRAEMSEPGGGGPVVYFWGTPAVSLSLRSVNWLEGLHVPLAGIRSGEGVLGWSASFRPLMEEYGKHMERIVRTLFNSLATDLKLDHAHLDSCMDPSNGIFRMYRYLCLPQAQSFIGMGAHTDSSVLTVVDEDDVGGLQVFHGDAWFHIMPVPNSLIVNIGDMLQVISNDEYRSVEHRVVDNGAKERISLCFFVFPKEAFKLRSFRYREFTYSEYKAQVQKDIKETGDKVGLKRFRL